MKAHRTHRTADDRRDSHPLRCSFPRDLHLRPHWSTFSRLQFKAEGPDFHTELIPVHSPLLRESHLVSFPALTYMLKFSAWSCLTSCLGVEGVKPPETPRSSTAKRTTNEPQSGAPCWCLAEVPIHLMRQRLCSTNAQRRPNPGIPGGQDKV